MNIASRGLACAAFFLAAACARAEAPFAFDTTPGALPKDVVPIAHTVRLVPDLAAHRFEGEQSVLIEVRRSTREIRLHALELEVTSASLAGPGLPRTALAAPRVDAAKQMLVFTPGRALRPGRYRLVMAWRGVINSTAEALFVDRYASPGGEKSLLATDFEPTGARRLLPCWDEPAFRTRFRFAVDLPAASTAVSNMPAQSRTPLPGGRVRTQFAATPKMPSYLIALVAGDLERTETHVDGTRIGIVAPVGKRGSAGYALAAAGQVLHEFNGYFGTPYPLPKLDHIAWPGGFAGAMENWGAIIYTEAALLVGPEGSERNKQRVFGTVAHETAHQWFGNLVTMAWWDDLWLNEAFATWMANKAADSAHPEWRVWLGAAERREDAMGLDARASTHPVRQPVATEAEAENAFDDITYEKGGGFLLMLEDHLGEAPFRAGIRTYIARHRGSNTTGADLWAALAEASGRPVAEIARAWLDTPGFPLVSVEARCEAGRQVLRFGQSVFRAEPAAASASASASASAPIWQVPIRVSSVGGAGARSNDAFLLTSASTDRTGGSACGDAALPVVDPGNVGYYRVRYAPPLFEGLLARWPELPDGARFKLASDSSALLQSGQLPLAAYLGVLERVPAEPRLAIWSRALADLSLFDSLADDAFRPALQRYAVRLLKPRFAALGWDEKPGEPGDDRQLRARLATALADADDAETLAEARTRFRRWLVEPASVPASMADALTHAAMRRAEPADWEALRARATRATASEERFRDFRALAWPRDPALAERALALSSAPEVPQIARQEMVWRVAEAGHGEAAWAYAEGHAEALVADIKHYGSGAVFARLARRAATAETADRLEALARAGLPEDARPEIRRAADEIRTRARLRDRLLPELKAALVRAP